MSRSPLLKDPCLRMAVRWKSSYHEAFFTALGLFLGAECMKRIEEESVLESGTNVSSPVNTKGS